MDRDIEFLEALIRSASFYIGMYGGVYDDLVKSDIKSYELELEQLKNLS